MDVGVSDTGLFRAPKKHISKTKDRDIPYRPPLITKPNKVEISL